MDEKQFPKLTIHNLGPIKDCEMVVNDFTVFVGPQSQGKSTIAKAVYFFRSVKQDIVDLMLRGWPVQPASDAQDLGSNTLNVILFNKFTRFFQYPFYGNDTLLSYHYTEDIWIQVSMIPNTDLSDLPVPQLKLVFEFSDKLSSYLISLDRGNPKAPYVLSPEYIRNQESNLERLFQDDYTSVYIPAGRHLTTLLNSQLNYVFTSMNDMQRFSMDYLTVDYIMQVLRLKPSFERGWDGLTVTLKQIMQRDIRTTLNRMKERSKKILGGEYLCFNGTERLYISDFSSIDLNYASSGQQETVWPLNLMFYYLLEEKKTFLIFEEPESNLYPDAQRTMGELLALFRNAGNQVMVTTHSPYLLGTFNYLLMGSQCESAGLADGLRETLESQYQLTPDFWLSPANTDAYFVSGGSMEDAKTDIDGVRMIKNELIDAVSEEINAVSDLFLGRLYGWDNGET